MKIRTSPALLGRTFPGGIYKAVISGRKVTTSKEAGNPLMQIEFTITSPGPDPKVETIGRKLWDNLTFTEQSIWKSNFLHVAVTGQDIPDKEFSSDEFFAYMWNVVQNKPVLLEVVEGSYNGQARMEISKVSRLAQ